MPLRMFPIGRKLDLIYQQLAEAERLLAIFLKIDAAHLSRYPDLDRPAKAALRKIRCDQISMKLGDKNRAQLSFIWHQPHVFCLPAP